MNLKKIECYYDPKKADAYIDYFSDGTNNKSAKTGTVNDDTENVDWNLVVNPAGLPINNAKITDTLGAQSRSTYVPGSIKVDNENAQIDLSDGPIIVNVEEFTDNVTTENIAGGAGQEPQNGQNNQEPKSQGEAMASPCF